MVIKKIPPRAVVFLSPEEQHRVVQVVVLFADVDRRVDGRRVKGRCVSANKRKSSEEKGTGLRQKKENRVRKFYGPCFLNQIIYHESVDLAASLDTIYFAANCYINHSGRAAGN
jgi:hypothetical protein